MARLDSIQILGLAYIALLALFILRTLLVYALGEVRESMACAYEDGQSPAVASALDQRAQVRPSSSGRSRPSPNALGGDAGEAPSVELAPGGAVAASPPSALTEGGHPLSDHGRMLRCGDGGAGRRASSSPPSVSAPNLRLVSERRPFPLSDEDLALIDERLAEIGAQTDEAIESMDRTLQHFDEHWGIRA